MTVQYGVHLDVLTTADPTVPASILTLQEGYNSGWNGVAILTTQSGSHFTIGNMLGAVLANDVAPGQPVAVHLAIAGTEEAGRVVRSWPSMITRVSPFQTKGETLGAACMVELVDPVTFLGSRMIWGAYAECSIGQALGGALSLAAGGDGKPTLTPILPGLPIVNIVEEFREELEVPYVIAAGQTLDEWLSNILGSLGIRVEMLGMADGSIKIMLSDRIPSGSPLQMSVVSDDSSSEDDQDNSNAGPIHITGLEGRPGMTLRGGILDDPSYGGFRYIGRLGAVGRLLSGPEIGVDEALRRIQFPVLRAYAEMLVTSSASRQPGLRPGRLVELDFNIREIGVWQLAQVSHRVEGGVYDNKAKMLRGDTSWHPLPPLTRPPVVVSGIVDGGGEYVLHEPVPRDRLGRILVTFPFIPISEEESEPPEPDAGGEGVVESPVDEQDSTATTEKSWPPRIPLAVIEPMAGGLHGFIPGHRQGDVCRVAVYSPLWAELIGFQYRNDRKINPEITGATAGLVVEHDYSESWSGLVFRRVEDLEESESDEEEEGELQTVEIEETESDAGAEGANGPSDVNAYDDGSPADA